MRVGKAEANFDRVARAYRWAEYIALGPMLQRARTFLLPALTHCRTAWVMGDGDGRFLAELLGRNQKLRAVAVDSSQQMLVLLRKRCRPFRSRVETIHASALEIDILPDSDLIVSHFLLDCFNQEEVNQLIQRTAKRVQAGTLWLVSDFSIPANEPIRSLACVYIRLLYLAFRVTAGLKIQRLPDVAQAMHSAGFRQVAHRTFLFGVLYTELWRFGEGARLQHGAVPALALPSMPAKQKDRLFPYESFYSSSRERGHTARQP